MRASSRIVRRHWLLAPLVLVLFIGLLGLGFWQLQRAEEKRAFLEHWQGVSRNGEAKPIREALKRQEKPFVRVWAEGHYDRSRHYLLDNQIRDHLPGYEVLTPLQLTGSDRLVLVNRGWMPRRKARGERPAIPTPAGKVRVTGLLVDPPQSGIQLGPPDPGKGRWPKLVQYVEPSRIAEQLQAPVAGRVIRLDPKVAHGFRRQWQAPVAFGPNRHIGYAIQWFALAATLLILSLIAVLRGRLFRGETEE